MTPLLVICGPTASGKTGLAVSLATALGGEVIGADSMQIYKGYDIATAKPTEAEKRGIPHHLIDFLDPCECFSAADYVRLAKPVIRDIASRGRLPVLCGGTGLYISSLVDNIAFETIQTGDGRIREELKQLAREKGPEHLFERLREVDPASAEKLHPNNLGRVIRALEVYMATGERMSVLRERARQTPEYNARMLGITYRSRESLYERINARIDDMLARGLLEEARAALLNGPQNSNTTVSQAIGYKEFGLYFEGAQSLPDAVERLKRSTRRYAKRQLTWFRRDERVFWLYRDDYLDDTSLLKAALDAAGDLKWENSPKELS
jgi:tRNA dimethylallyltransferase